MGIHRTAAQGYATAGTAYERSRPTYPGAVRELLEEELGVGPGRTVLDLAAGTGKLSRLLTGTGARVVAVEPVPAMLAELVFAVPGAQAVAGTAEAIPIGGGVIDAVVVGTAFHWFRGRPALAEIHRVLRPAGGLALVWNNPDRSHPWVARVWEIVDEYRRGTPSNRDLRWREAFDAAPFAPLRHGRYTHAHRLGIDDLLTRIESISFIAALESGQRCAAINRVRAVVDGEATLAQDRPFDLPYRTDVYWTRAVASSAVGW